jgi:hypothetical protein
LICLEYIIEDVMPISCVGVETESS